MNSRLIISLFALLGSMTSWAAPAEHEVKTQVVFGLGKTEVDPQLNGNKQTVKYMDELFADDVLPVRVEILSVSSPEGPYAYNKRLSQGRAKGMETFLRERYPALASVEFVTNTVDEDWTGVADYLKRSSYEWKDDALKIVQLEGADRKARLKELWVGEAWDHLMKNCFPYLRRAQITFIYSADKMPLSFEDCSAGDLRLKFRSGYRNLDSSLADNAELLAAIKNKISSGYNGPIVLSGYSSPDGSETANIKLAHLRAQSVRRYLVEQLSYPDSLIAVSPGQVDWQHLTCLVRNGYLGADRDEVLKILNDGEKTSVQKKRALLRLKGGETWRQLKENFKSELCAVSVHFSDSPAVVREEVKPSKPSGDVDEKPAVDTTETKKLIEVKIEKEQGTVVDTLLLHPVDSLPVQGDTLLVPDKKTPTEGIVESDVSKFEDISKTKHGEQKAIFAVGTNALLDLGTAVNVSVEVPVGKHWDITADYIFPWWKDRAHSFAFEILHLDLGARYYFKPWQKRDASVLRGWYASASAGLGYYDFAPWGDGVQGEEIKLSLGGGYTWALGDWWRLSAELGVGPVFTRYRNYQHQPNGDLLWISNQNRVLFGPTSAKISFSYLLHTRK